MDQVRGILEEYFGKVADGCFPQTATRPLLRLGISHMAGSFPLGIGVRVFLSTRQKIFLQPGIRLKAVVVTPQALNPASNSTRF